MYKAKIYMLSSCDVVLGPTESRDEASRLARAWIEAHAGLANRETKSGMVTGVSILKVSDEDEEV